MGISVKLLSKSFWQKLARIVKRLRKSMRSWLNATKWAIILAKRWKCMRSWCKKWRGSIWKWIMMAWWSTIWQATSQKKLNVLLEVQNVISGGCKWMMASNLKKMAKCKQRLAKNDEYIRIERDLKKDTNYCFNHDENFYELTCKCFIEKGDLAIWRFAAS